MPISGVLGRAAIMDAPDDSTIGGTFVGNPIGCEAALAVLDVIADEGLLARGTEIGDAAAGRLRGRSRTRTPAIGDVRGLGPMLGVEFVRERRLARRRSRVARSSAESLARGLILLKAGVNGNVIRTLVPLVISDEQLDESIAVFGAAVAVRHSAVVA